MSSDSERPSGWPTFARQARWAAGALLTVAATFLAAHEGHAPLPTKGAVADTVTGHLLLTDDARQSIDVATEPVELRTLDERVLAYASVVAPWRNHGFATAVLPGRVVKVHVVPGQAVRAGEVLAEVESPELDALQQDVLTAQSEVRLSEKLVTELGKSADAGAVAGQAVLDAETKHAQNRNALEVTRARWAGLGLPRSQFDDLLATGAPRPGLTLPVVSPVPGVIAHAELTAGKVVEPAEHLAEVVDLSVVWVKVGVLERDLRKVKIGQTVEVELVAYPGRSFRTQVRAVSPALDPATNVFTVWAELSNPDSSEPLFQPGMAGSARVLVPGDKPRPAVPAAAVVREGAERFVLVEEARAGQSSEYRRVPVVPGREENGAVELLAGTVYPGDRVVTRGATLLGPFFAPTVLAPSAEATRTMRLRVEPAAVGPVDEVAVLDGAVEVEPAARGSASSQLAGTVRSIRVDRGQEVRAGEVLAEVFSPELLTTQQEFLRTELEATLTAQTLKTLKTAPGVAARRLWELESQVTTLRARAGALRRQLTTAGLTAEQVEGVVAKRELVATVPVRAPLSGAVVGFDKVLGQAVAAHEPLFEVHDLRRPQVRGYLSERDVGRVRIGQPVRVRLVAAPETVLTGTVVRSARNVTVDARTLSVWVELSDRSGATLRHNQLASLAVTVGARPPGVRVPRAAVVSDGATAFVFVQQSGGRFERRAVATGPADDQFVTVTRGLAAGDPVATAGAAELMTAFASLR
ncbi:Cobalt-zinc-cadmium resistance protein CzcB [Gemmata obscuriglobus]|uniref:Efflux RND transporter periplasmic adaptor subunit n=1 Tax=Gemmata obscuriglobus TaxID=114 RepID=A0A2Z3HCT6_9BACT|nr:efflux RND transporter periplasmic adaptor subunit [Gemmata obscuriglobus]AWM39070.1 hypothetical protein C1280_20175 [Gemmata obscuriglobus]QEG27894.1 Cobalt-zinc-cadmium resistance protein CzcB [Gemmata obscuriglobus]VTS05314.1 rnd transporter : Efflux transporter, RND family, MFP subunit OS=uncultured planctomycete GN=HGMM_F01A04C20 PE=4 SV=1: Biotin_lipoyl_2: HlyD_3: HlyD_2 [Gemmata obscuriglobus UQM 2246]